MLSKEPSKRVGVNKMKNSMNIDIAKLVKFTEVKPRKMQEMGEHGTVVTMVGIIGLRHSSGYEVVVRTAKGKYETRNPQILAPVFA